MFAMMGMLASGRDPDTLAEDADVVADEMMDARSQEPEDEVDQGIAAIKPKRKYERKSTN
jgi:hypothetical protein